DPPDSPDLSSNLPGVERTETIALPQNRSASASDRLPLLRITVTAGPNAGMVVVTSLPRAVIGRAQAADVKLTDPTVSLLHAEVEGLQGPTSDGVVIRDLDSHNGTYVRGDVGVGIVRVPFGTELRLGTSRLTIARVEDQVSERSKAMSFGHLVGASP